MLFEAVKKNEPFILRRIVQDKLNLTNDPIEILQEKVTLQKKVSLNEILDKNNCLDMFRDQDQAVLKFIKFKFKLKSLNNLYQKCKILKKLRVLKGVLALEVFIFTI